VPSPHSQSGGYACGLKTRRAPLSRPLSDSLARQRPRGTTAPGVPLCSATLEINSHATAPHWGARAWRLVALDSLPLLSPAVRQRWRVPGFSARASPRLRASIVAPSLFTPARNPSLAAARCSAHQNPRRPLQIPVALPLPPRLMHPPVARAHGSFTCRAH
jgi:hypothetical protein